MNGRYISLHPILVPVVGWLPDRASDDGVRDSMRYFTMGWGSGDERDDPSAAYAAHLDAIRDQLPPDLLATQESVSLHDTRLRELRLIVAERSLSVALDSHSGRERFTLIYGGVERFESSADPKVGLNGPAGYRDLGYCEVDVLVAGAFEHRLLFSTGIEVGAWSSEISGFCAPSEIEPSASASGGHDFGQFSGPGFR